MQGEYIVSQFAATVALLIFSVGLGYLKLRYFGFGQDGFQDLVRQYEERRKTALGKRAHRPLLIRCAEDPLQVFGRSILPTLVNGAILLALGFQGFYALVPMIAVPLALAEFALAWYIQAGRVPMYQRDFAEYLRLTADSNRSLDGQVKDWDVALSPSELASTRLLSGGRIITVASDRKGHQFRTLRLFHPFSAVPLPAPDQSVRVFYLPQKEVRGKAIDGVLLGCQVVERAPRRKSGDLSFDEYAERRTVN